MFPMRAAPARFSSDYASPKLCPTSPLMEVRIAADPSLSWTDVLRELSFVLSLSKEDTSRPRSFRNLIFLCPRQRRRRNMRSSQFDKVHGESPLSVPRVSMSPSPLGVTPRARSRSPQISTCTLSVKMEEVESGPVEDADRTGHGLSVGMTFEDTPGKMTVRSDSVPYVPPTAQPLEATASAHEGGCTTASNVFPVKEEDSDTRKTNFVEPEQLGPVAHEHASSKLETDYKPGKTCDAGMTCTICLLPNFHPRVLSCGHVFCEGCVVDRYEHHYARALDFDCPLCGCYLEKLPVPCVDYQLKEVVEQWARGTGIEIPPSTTFHWPPLRTRCTRTYFTSSSPHRSPSMPRAKYVYMSQARQMELARRRARMCILKKTRYLYNDRVLW